MKNADMPAMAQHVAQTLDSGMVCSYDFVGASGLTKRKQAAISAMQGLLVSHPQGGCDFIANKAVEQADALFDRLEKK